ncbi:DUF6252 family protein [Rasiella sp. SM2506]|uniref:DUF6252 family protein n=1 Tax=Rasiella sp. SM2506 TaxID=3423914 RepID=UPI003D79B347
MNKTKTLKTRFHKIAFILLLVSIPFSSCSSDDDATTPEQTNFFLTAKIDGVDFSANSADPLASISNNQTQIFTITGINNNGGRITLTLPSPIIVGTFTTDTGAILSFVSPNVEVWGATEDAGTGTITITANNTTAIEGTFSFTGVNPADNSTKVITEGKFKAKKL